MQDEDLLLFLHGIPNISSRKLVGLYPCNKMMTRKTGSGMVLDFLKRIVDWVPTW